MDSSHELFERAWRVTIGPPGQTGRVWTGLRTRFEIHKTADSSPNKLKLGIYNLSKDSRHYIENGGRTYAVQVEAGYAADLRMLFSGRLELASSNTQGRQNHHHQGADWLTEVEGTDGGHPCRTVVISKSFGPKTGEHAIIDEVAKALGVTLGKITGLPKKQANHGRSLSGPAAAELDRLCATHRLRWSIQDGALHILPYGAALNPTAFVISPATGMIGSPERTERGVKVVSLLQGGINPGRLIEIRSSDLKGTYVVEDVKHHGDSHELDWYTEIEAIPLSS
jgi:hypothetical protein